MDKARPWIVIVLFLLGVSYLIPGSKVWASPFHEPSPGELIAAVNNLRLANGLAPLETHPVLMQTAQGQADALLATEGAVGHARPNGITFTQQLLLLGYPLSGDLSLGGYRSENFVFGYQLTPIDAVEAWRGDEPHTNTMLSPNRSDIGAGVAVAGEGQIYYVIDTALRTASGLPQSEASLYLPGGAMGTPNPGLAVNQYIIPVSVATARPNGDVYHSVQYGQTLWSIAIEYSTKIDLIRQLNHLSGDTVFPNQLLLVKRGATQPAPIATGPLNFPTPMPFMTDTLAEGVSLTQMPLPTAETARELDTQETSSRRISPSVWIALVIFLLIVGGGSAVWFIREPNQ